MTSSTIPEPTLEQQYTDLAMAHAELRDARQTYFEISENARARNPRGFKGEVSVYYAQVQVDSAESRLNNLTAYYNGLNLGSRTEPTTASDAVAEESPTIGRRVIEISDSEDDEPGNGQAQSSSPGPAPAYTSWPPTPPHFYTALFEERQAQAPEVPSTPSHRHARDEGGSSQLLIPPPSTQPPPSAPSAPPTPGHITRPITIVRDDGILTSPHPKKKHYIVTQGRRTGIYSSWPEAKPYIDGLGASAAWQGFKTYKEAFESYMGARERGLLLVIRLDGDTVEKYGPVDFAEDL